VFFFVLHGRGKSGELLLEGPAQTGFLLLLTGGVLKDKDGPLRKRPGLLVCPVGDGIDVDVVVLGHPRGQLGSRILHGQR
jgi:hypothetical protein